MDFRIACRADAEISRCPDFPDQIGRVRIGAVLHVLRAHAFRQVSPQCHNVPDAGIFHCLQIGPHVLPSRAYAGQMGQGFHAVRILQPAGNFHGVFSALAARAVGHGDKGRLQRCDCFRRLRHFLKSRVSLWREHFKGQRQPLIPDRLKYLHLPVSSLSACLLSSNSIPHAKTTFNCPPENRLSFSRSSLNCRYESIIVNFELFPAPSS